MYLKCVVCGHSYVMAGGGWVYLDAPRSAGPFCSILCRTAFEGMSREQQMAALFGDDRAPKLLALSDTEEHTGSWFPRFTRMLVWLRLGDATPDCIATSTDTANRLELVRQPDPED